jgi:small subunit ribosomal protein S1
MQKDPKGESFAALFEASQAAPVRRNYRQGDELDVVVVQIGRDAVFVELDGKQEGFIEAKDLTTGSGDLTVKVGSRVTARVVEVGGRPGAVRLAPVFVRPPAESVEGEPVEPERDATPPGAALAVGTKVIGTVALVERYGVFLQITTPAAPAQGRRGLRGLIPTSELGVPRGADLHKHFPVGKELEAKVVAIDERGRIRLSIVELAADDERRAFQAFESKSAQGTDPKGTTRFGTLGDLLSKTSASKDGASAGGKGKASGGVVRRKK